MCLYFVGVFIAVCMIASYMWIHAKKQGELVLQDVLIVMAVSVFSWGTVVIFIIALIIYVIDECPDIVIWRRKEE